jgi:hypothetical protein
LIFQGTLFVMDGTLNLVLLSVIGGMVILGLFLKFRLQYHERRKPSESGVTKAVLRKKS